MSPEARIKQWARELGFDGCRIARAAEATHASAYQGALEGEVAVVLFGDEENETAAPSRPARRDGRFIDDDDPDYDPFAALKDWKPGD